MVEVKETASTRAEPTTSKTAPGGSTMACAGLQSSSLSVLALPGLHSSSKRSTAMGK